MQAKASGLTVCVSDRKGSFDHETFTLIHEFGHLYGAEDHYGDRYAGSKTTAELEEEYNYNLDFDNDCIYGADKESLIDPEDMKVCDGCRELIESGITAKHGN